MNWWLNSYAYHIDLKIVTILTSAVVCLVIALLTVSYHAAKAAMVDPVRSLRYE
jgi:putative ABC transport system permease protein